MFKREGGVLFILLCFGVLLSGGVEAALLDPNETGFGGQSRSENYDSLLDALYAGGAVQNIGDKLWVPWYSTSSSCTVNDLQRGGNCNSGQNIDMTHNCMVSDEFSQVGIMASMGSNQQRMNEYFNTVQAIKSSFGDIPAWRVYRDGSSIQACRDGINGNCDTASDATARIIISLYNAAANPLFTDEAKKQEYKNYADNLIADFVNYELKNECKQNSFGGQTCYWMAAGSQARNGGFQSHNFAYTGYFQDGIIALLQGCHNTGNNNYCNIANDLVLNFLEAADYNGQEFTAPPGQAFKWNMNGIPEAECTDDCDPPLWDYADASRAVGICQAVYYADMINHDFPLLQQYCNQWGQEHMNNPNSAPIQYYENGDALNYQSGYFAQGLQASFEAGYRTDLFEPSLDSALSHYSPSSRTWDNAACFGVYMQTFAVRSLGFGIGRDAPSFGGSYSGGSGGGNGGGNNSGGGGSGGGNNCYDSVENIPASCNGGSITSDNWNGCRTIVCSANGNSLQIMACDKPDGNPQYFEMYKQNEVGSGLEICIHETCISSNGYAQSSNFPICVEGSGGGSGGEDTIPPEISNGQPTGTLGAGTTQTTISANTNENAECRYSTSSGQGFNSMTGMSGSGSTSHSAQVSGLQDGQSYNYYLKCKDNSGNVNSGDYVISFSVASGNGNGNGNSNNNGGGNNGGGNGGNSNHGGSGGGSLRNGDNASPLGESETIEEVETTEENNSGFGITGNTVSEDQNDGNGIFGMIFGAILAFVALISGLIALVGGVMFFLFGSITDKIPQTLHFLQPLLILLIGKRRYYTSLAMRARWGLR